MKTWIIRAARDELDAAANWYEQQAAGLGNEFVEEMVRAVATISERPEIWPLWPKVPAESQLRRFLVPRFRHAVGYIVESDVVVIIAFAHQRRRPFYWRSRLKNLT